MMKSKCSTKDTLLNTNPYRKKEWEAQFLGVGFGIGETAPSPFSKSA